jgi:hypothetical protein
MRFTVAEQLRQAMAISAAMSKSLCNLGFNLHGDSKIDYAKTIYGREPFYTHVWLSLCITCRDVRLAIHNLDPLCKSSTVVILEYGDPELMDKIGWVANYGNLNLYEEFHDKQL